MIKKVKNISYSNKYLRKMSYFTKKFLSGELRVDFPDYVRCHKVNLKEGERDYPMLSYIRVNSITKTLASFDNMLSVRLSDRHRSNL